MIYNLDQIIVYLITFLSVPHYLHLPLSKLCTNYRILNCNHEFYFNFIIRTLDLPNSKQVC
jgi:hypothetical protein